MPKRRRFTPRGMTGFEGVPHAMTVLKAVPCSMMKAVKKSGLIPAFFYFKIYHTLL